MKSRILLLVLCLSCAITSVAALVPEDVEEETESTKIDGFRDFKWGTSKEEVEQSVISGEMYYGKDFQYIDPNGICILNGSVSNYSANVYYNFDDDDRFVEGMYILNETHTDDNAYYDDYCKLVDLYTEVYGEPSSTVEDWSNDLYKDDESYIGFAISLGYAEFATRWNDDDGNHITILINGDNYKIYTCIDYRSSDYSSTSNTDGI